MWVRKLKVTFSQRRSQGGAVEGARISYPERERETVITLLLTENKWEVSDWLMTRSVLLQWNQEEIHWSADVSHCVIRAVTDGWQRPGSDYTPHWYPLVLPIPLLFWKKKKTHPEHTRTHTYCTYLLLQSSAVLTLCCGLCSVAESCLLPNAR